MKQIQYLILLLLFSGIVSASQANQVIDQIAESHIDGNVPDKSDFDSFMHRDLEVYFKRVTGKLVDIQYEFLRNGPTQTGIAYPKFYLWVKIFENKSLLDQGAVRVAAIEKKRFEITDFIGKGKIEQNPDSIFMVFPRPVCEKINEKIR